MHLQEVYFSIIIYLTYVSRLHCQEISSCFDEFTVSTEAATFVTFTKITSSVSSLVVKVSEVTDVSDILYSISWIDPISTNPYYDDDEDDNTALDYTEIVLNGALLSVELVNSMEGIMDYNNTERQEFVYLTLYFEFSNLPSTCIININHDLLDSNTAEPSFTLDEYSFNLREDYPIFMEIPDFEPIAYDFDANYPNNYFLVETSPGCPLMPVFNTYQCSEGNPVIVFFGLVDYLDYDTMEESRVTCTVTLTDFGVPSLMSNSTTITMTVTPFPDENPDFSLDFYQGSLEDPLAGSMVEVDPPIEAEDPDVPPSDYIVYSMVPADNDVGGDEYFSINGSTGEVTVIQDIENDFLSWEIVTFILTACDGDDQCSKSYLSISLPPQSPDGSESLEFEKDFYSSQILSPLTIGVVVEQVYAESSDDQDSVRYSFYEDESPGLQYFSINEITGEIVNTQTNISSENYFLQTIATDGNLYDRTTVNIEIITLMINDVIIQESIVFTTIIENHGGDIYTIKGIGANYFCILDVQPEEIKWKILVNDTGTIYSSYGFEADNSTLGTKVTIKAAAYSKPPTECVSSSISTTVLKNEVLIEMEVLDEDDNAPYFYSPNGKFTYDITYAYPKEVPLQKAIGPVATLVAKDDDVFDMVTYKIYHNYYNEKSYKVDYYSGELYLAGELDIYSRFDVEALSNLREIVMYVNCEVLDMRYISTLYFNSLNQSEVENKISEISVLSGVNVYLLYSSLVVRNGGYSAVEAHVYCICLNIYGSDYLCDTQNLITSTNISDFVSDLQPFSDAKYYTVEDDNDDFKTSTIVLGCLTGLLLVLTVAFVVYKCCKKNSAVKTKTETLNKGKINTDFKDDYNEPAFENIFENSPVDSNVRDSIKQSNTSDSTRSSIVVVVQEPSESLDSYNSRIDTNNNSNETLDPIDASYGQHEQHKTLDQSSDNIPNLNANLNEIHETINESLEFQPLQYHKIEYSSLDDTNDTTTETPNTVEMSSSQLQPVPLIYPSLDSLEKYDGETEPKKYFEETKQRDNLETSYRNETESLAVATAPELEELDSEIEFSVNSDKRSNLKVFTESDQKSTDDEEKSVAFKVLVDTMEFEPEKNP